jgi:hypothetical protein
VPGQAMLCIKYCDQALIGYGRDETRTPCDVLEHAWPITAIVALLDLTSKGCSAILPASFLG